MGFWPYILNNKATSTYIRQRQFLPKIHYFFYFSIKKHRALFKYKFLLSVFVAAVYWPTGKTGLAAGVGAKS